METLELNNKASYYGAYKADSYKDYENSQNKTIEDGSDDSLKHKLHNSAVNVSISMESLKVYLNIKSAEFTQENSNAQNSLLNIINNEQVYNFLSGKENEGFSLSSLGYDGKPITQLSPEEAKELVSDEGFFGVTQTSQRVSSFVISLAGDDLEALQEVRNGVIKGFEEAEKLWGGQLPEISYETQKQTLALIDEKIASLTQTDLEKEVEE